MPQGFYEMISNLKSTRYAYWPSISHYTFLDTMNKNFEALGFPLRFYSTVVLTFPLLLTNRSHKNFFKRDLMVLLSENSTAKQMALKSHVEFFLWETAKLVQAQAGEGTTERKKEHMLLISIMN